MRIKLIEDLPMATSAELYQLSWVIEQLLADPDVSSRSVRICMLDNRFNTSAGPMGSCVRHAS